VLDVQRRLFDLRLSGDPLDADRMIKVQPAQSRIVKTETADKITLKMPPIGLLSVWNVVLVLGALWVVVFAEGVKWLWTRNMGDLIIVACVFGLPGLFAILAAISVAWSSWTLQRDADWLTFRRSGILGIRTRRWPIAEVATLFVRESHTSDTWRLSVAFRNGRSEELVQAADEEDLQWLVAMLSDARGERKSASLLEIAAEPERRKVNPETVPSTLTCRTSEEGVEVVFRPLLRSRGLWWRLPLAALLGILAVVGVSIALYRGTQGAFPLAIPRLTIAAIVGVVGWSLWVLNKSAVIQVADGLVHIVQNPGQKRQQFGKIDVEFVQTYRSAGHTELQFLLRSLPKVRLFDGRPAEELEWAARFLRVAIKGVHVPETATMQVDAAAGVCQVCLEKMDSRVVYCAKCRTPHHEECWSYMGQCSTYGCREIRFQRT
jgi:hypothetical protein